MAKNPDKKQCKAKSKQTGKRCKNWATPGKEVCRFHGGKSTGAPPVKLKQNQNSKKHGLFAKYLPQETMDIVNEIDNISPIDILWMNIKMQFASIIRAQQIMFVESKEDTTKELKKLKVENIPTADGGTQIPTEKEYEIQYAWDKQAVFMNSLSRSMAELRSMLKQFYEMAHADDDRLLEVERMRAVIAKTKAETDRVQAETKNEEEGTSRVVIVNDKEAMRKAMQNDNSD